MFYLPFFLGGVGRSTCWIYVSHSTLFSKSSSFLYTFLINLLKLHLFTFLLFIFSLFFHYHFSWFFFNSHFFICLLYLIRRHQRCYSHSIEGPPPSVAADMAVVYAAPLHGLNRASPLRSSPPHQGNELHGGDVGKPDMQLRYFKAIDRTYGVNTVTALLLQRLMLTPARLTATS